MYRNVHKAKKGDSEKSATYNPTNKFEPFGKYKAGPHRRVVFLEGLTVKYIPGETIYSGFERQAVPSSRLYLD